ncbi:hypothetical protein [Ramlibacter sp.]|uniref:hypothetical protein n=1 Tax=Ramlibacter sp. TaxID=1917967 RepID=UPI002FCA34D9
MKLATCALLVAAALTGCATDMRSPSTAASGASGSSTSAASSTRAAGASGDMRAEMNARMCQVFRSYQGRGEDAWLRESCTRHLGAQGCDSCLSGQ